MRLMRVLSAIILVMLFSPVWAANPFLPPEKVQLFYEVVYPDDKQTPIAYKMYMQSEGRITALLNNTFVSEGAEFSGMKVLKINDKRVVLVSPSGQKRVVVIDAMQSKLAQLRKILDEESQ